MTPPLPPFYKLYKKTRKMVRVGFPKDKIPNKIYKTQCFPSVSILPTFLFQSKIRSRTNECLSAQRMKSSRPEGPKAGPKGRTLEVGAWRAPRLLFVNIL